MPNEERVLCFERSLFEKLGVFQGLSLEVEKYLPAITASRLVYLNRSEAEQDRRHKQLIHYCLLVSGGKILRYRRGKAGGEARLHGLYSVGIGGHISEDDNSLFASSANGYTEGMRREIREEVAIDDFNDVPVAVINDDSTDVGYVHFGVVHLVQLPNERIVNRSSGINSPEFIPIADALRDPASYESWSRFCLENLQALLAEASASPAKSL